MRKLGLGCVAWFVTLLVLTGTAAAESPLDAVAEPGVLHGPSPPSDPPEEEQPLPAKGSQVLEDATREGGSRVPAPVSRVPFLPEAEWSLGDVNATVVAVAGLGALGILGVGVYAGTRYLTRDDVLANDVRGRIFTHIRERTGANLKQITDDLHLTTTNAIWHLRKLEEAGLVHSRRFNGYKVFYAAEGGVEARRMSLSITALQNDNAQEVFEYVVSHPGTHQREIARALGVNHGTVRWHLKKLMRAELVDERRKGKTATYLATDLGLTALKRVLERQAAGRAIPLSDGRAVSV